jgi:drug/metabolite transporter (DMT)-like permease
MSQAQTTEIPAITETDTPKTGPYLALLTGLLILGASAILIRAADAPGPVSGAYRMGIGWLGLSVLILFRHKRPSLSRQALLWAALAGLFFGLDMTFWTTGIMLVGATKPTLLANTTPLWVGLGAIIFYREKHPLLFWIGLIVALSGAALMLGRDLQINADLALGSLFGLVSAFFYSSFFLAAQRGRKLTDALTFVWISTLVSTLVLFLVAVLLGQPLTGYSQQTVVIFIIMGIVIQVAGWLLITYAQGHIPASIISPTMLGQPVLTGLFAAPLLGEVFTPLDFVGGFAVLGGVLLVHASKRNKE